MTEPVKCWIDPRGMVFVLIYPQPGDTPAIAMPLRLAERLVQDAGHLLNFADTETSRVERENLRDMIREMREEV